MQRILNSEVFRVPLGLRSRPLTYLKDKLYDQIVRNRAAEYRQVPGVIEVALRAEIDFVISLESHSLGKTCVAVNDLKRKFVPGEIDIFSPETLSTFSHINPAYATTLTRLKLFDGKRFGSERGLARPAFSLGILMLAWEQYRNAFEAWLRSELRPWNAFYFPKPTEIEKLSEALVELERASVGIEATLPEAPELDFSFREYNDKSRWYAASDEWRRQLEKKGARGNLSATYYPLTLACRPNSIAEARHLLGVLRDLIRAKRPKRLPVLVPKGLEPWISVWPLGNEKPELDTALVSRAVYRHALETSATYLSHALGLYVSASTAVWNKGLKRMAWCGLSLGTRYFGDDLVELLGRGEKAFPKLSRLFRKTHSGQPFEKNLLHLSFVVEAQNELGELLNQRAAL